MAFKVRFLMRFVGSFEFYYFDLSAGKLCEQKGFGSMKIKWRKRNAFLHISNKSTHSQHNNNKSCGETPHENSVGLFEYKILASCYWYANLCVQCSRCEFWIDEIAVPFVGSS